MDANTKESEPKKTQELSENKTEVQEKPQEQPKKGWFGLTTTTVLNFLSYPTALMIGYIAAKNDIRRESVRVHMERKDSVLKSLMAEAEENILSKPKEYLEKAIKAGKTYPQAQKDFAKWRETVEDEVKHNYFKSAGYKGIWHNYQDLAKNDKVMAGVTFVTVSSMALGALLIAANGRDIWESLIKGDDKRNFLDALLHRDKNDKSNNNHDQKKSFVDVVMNNDSTHKQQEATAR